MSRASPVPPSGGSREAAASPVRVAIDAMGGDHAPEVTVAGAVLAARELGIPVWIVGHEDVLNARLRKFDIRDLPITLHHAPEVIGMDESPVVAIRRKPRCSLRSAFELLHSKTVDAVVSAGNSGAVMAAALFVAGRLPGVERPAIAVPIPSGERNVVLLDAGANVDASPVHLVQFAVMGEIYARMICGITNPKVGLLSNGEEEGKGTEVTRLASGTLKGMALNFVGNVEGQGLFSGGADVVACDGFVGNAVLKAVEGFGEQVSEALNRSFDRSWRTRLAFLLARRSLVDLRAHFDYAERGGAPLLGIDGTAIVCHGRSGALAIRNAIRTAHESARVELGRHIAEAIRAMDATIAAGPTRRRRFWSQLRGRLSGQRVGRGEAHVDSEPTRTGDEGDRESVERPDVGRDLDR